MDVHRTVPCGSVGQGRRLLPKPIALLGAVGRRDLARTSQGLRSLRALCSQCHPGWGFKKKKKTISFTRLVLLLESFEVQLVSWPNTRQIEARRGGGGSRCWALQSAGTGNPAGRCSPRANCEELGSGEASAARGEKGKHVSTPSVRGPRGDKVSRASASKPPHRAVAKVFDPWPRGPRQGWRGPSTWNSSLCTRART